MKKQVNSRRLEEAGEPTETRDMWRDGQASTLFYGDWGETHRYGDELLRSLTGRNPDLLDAAEEVAAEQHARLFLVSRERQLTHELLSYLRQEMVPPTLGRCVHHGIWLLVTLPSPAGTNEIQLYTMAAEGKGVFDNWVGEDEEGVGMLLEHLNTIGADVVLYLVDRETGWCAEDTAWVAQLRTLGAPLLPLVLDRLVVDGNKQCGEESDWTQEALTASIHRQIGIKPVFIQIDDAFANKSANSEVGKGSLPPADVATLTQRIVSLRPRVAVALAQDIAWCRPILARRIIRTGALFTALLSAQPVPLLDLPFQVMLQWKVALQLAAVYGRPGLDYRSKEMIGTIAWNLVIRFAMQQTVRLVPVAGWLLSAIIGGVSTALLGHALVTIYENEDRWDLERQSKRALDRAGVVVAPVRQASVRAANAVRTQTEALSQRVGRMGKAVHTAWRDDASSVDPPQMEAAEQPDTALTEIATAEIATAEIATAEMATVNPPPCAQTDAITQDVRTISVINLDALHKHTNGDR